MDSKWRRFAFIAGLAVFCAAASAAPPTPADFVSDPTISDAAISPSGRYIAYSAHANGAQALFVRDLEDQSANKVKIVSTIPDSAKTKIQWVEWKGDDRILYGVELYNEKHVGNKDSGRIYGYTYSRAVFAADRVGGNDIMLLSARRTADLSRVLSMLRDDPNHVLIASPAPNDNFSVYKVDVHTGLGELIEKGEDITFAWKADATGKVAARFDWDRLGDGYWIYSRAANGVWTKDMHVKYVKLNTKKQDFDFLAPTSTPDEFYVAYTPPEDKDGNTISLRTYNVRTHTLGPVLWNNPQYDLAAIKVSSRTNELLGECYIADRYECEYKDPTVNALYAGLNNFFQHEVGVDVYSASDNERRWILQTHGPQDPGSFYLFDLDAKNVVPLGRKWSNLPTLELGKAEKINVKARDGAAITAYLTMPPHANGAPPLVVMPHGGPEDRDSLDYNRWVQFIATRGYAVLQVNFRGSSGFGQSFAKAGRRQWGGRMQDDLTDGVKTLIAAGRIDSKRICIVGASYGGYAALYGGAQSPDMYKCVVSIAGVTDLPDLLSWEKEQEGGNSGTYKYVLDEVGDPHADDDMLHAKSPTRLAATYKVPVLLLHGELDDVVPLNQSQEMAGALKKSGVELKLVIMPQEGHPAWSDFHEMQAMNEVAAFLQAHIPVTP